MAVGGDATSWGSVVLPGVTKPYLEANYSVILNSVSHHPRKTSSLARL